MSAGERVRAIRLTPADDAWTAVVARHADATPFHHPAWLAAICDAYALTPLVFGLETADGTLDGGIPFVQTGNRVVGRRWTALPFTDACAPLLGERSSADELAALLARVQRDEG